MPALIPARLERFPMGKVVGGGRFALSYDDWKYHRAVLGGTGSGKSKFLELFYSYLLHHHQSGILIDPHGDLADNLLAFVAHRKRNGDDALWRRVHYLEVGPQSAFSYDPFALAPRLADVSRIEYDAWLKAKVDRVCRAFLLLSAVLYCTT